jgi:hypothetical protein
VQDDGYDDGDAEAAGLPAFLRDDDEINSLLHGFG